MPGNVVGEAWVAIRPDLSGFATSLTAGLTDAITKVQAVADARPIKLRVALDVSEAVAQLSALNLAAGGAGGGSGIIGGAVAGGAAGGGGNGGFAAGIAAQRLLGVGPGASRGIFGIGAGLAGGFSLLSFAGLGVEHVLTTIIGLVGSLAGAIGGGLLLALGAASVAIVGMGSDLLVMKSVIADTKTLGQSLTAIQTAQLTYGKNSAQAAAATQALNVQMQLLGDTAGVKAELGLAKALQAVNAYWDKATSTARVAAVNFIEPFLTVAYTYIPLINQAATTNFGIMTQAFEPLIAFMNGPGTAIFKQLEAVFAKDLPYVIGAVTQGIELLLRSVDYLSSFVGGLSKSVDDFLTRANGPGWSNWVNTMTTLIGLFHTWYDFLKIIVIDVVDFFKLTAGLGSSIIQTLTGMLTQLHNWLNLTTTKTSLHNLFELHKQEVIDLLHLLPILLGSLGNIYLTIAPLLTGALVTVLNVLVPILKIITSNAWGAWLVGIGLILAKLGLLTTALGLVKGVVGTIGGWAGLGGGATGAVSATTLGKGVTPVYVTNWAQIGGGGGVPSAVTKTGVGAFIAEALAGSGLAELLAPIAASVLGLLGGIWILNAISKHPNRSPTPQGPGTGGAPSDKVSSGFSALWNALQDSSNAVYRSSALFMQDLETDLRAAGVPLSKVPGDAKAIADAYASGRIKTQAGLNAFVQNLTGIVDHTKLSNTFAGALQGLIGKTVAQIGPGFVGLENSLTGMGLSFSISAGVASFLQTYISKYGPLSATQILALKDALTHGATSAWDIYQTLYTVDVNLQPAILSASQISAALAALHKSIPGTVNLTGGGIGFFGGSNLPSVPPSGSTKSTNTVKTASGHTINITQNFSGSGNAQMQQIVDAANRRFLTTLRSL